MLTCRDVDEGVGDVDEDGVGDDGGVRIVSGLVTMMATSTSLQYRIECLQVL